MRTFFGKFNGALKAFIEPFCLEMLEAFQKGLDFVLGSCSKTFLVAKGSQFSLAKTVGVWMVR